MAPPYARPEPPLPSEEEGQTIRVVSRLTGISVDTLRVWERRYGFPRPSRRAGSNRRLYSPEDVERLRWVARALQQGYRAGDVIGKQVADLRGLLAEGASAPSTERPPASASVEHLVERLTADDLIGVEGSLRQSAAALGPRRFVTEVAHPFLVAVGDAWERGGLHVRQEHAASQVLRTQLRSMLAAYQDLEARPIVLLATLPGEPHDLALEMVALYLAVSSAKPRLLGASTPVSEIVEAVRALDADVVGLTITSGAAPNVRRDVLELARNLPRRVPLWIGGRATDLDEPVEAVRLIRSWADVDEALRAQRHTKGLESR